MTDSIIVKEYPKLLILTFGFQFAKMMGILQLSHVLGSPYKVYKPVFLIPLFSLLMYSIVFYLTGYRLLVSIDALILATFVWNFLSWIHYVYFCSEEICEILKIACENVRTTSPFGVIEGIEQIEKCEIFRGC